MTNGNCRVSNKKLEHVIDFGPQPLGNGFLNEKHPENEYFFDMQCGYCAESKMFQLVAQPDSEKMFHDQYAFYSSTSKFMAQHFKNFADKTIAERLLNSADPFIVELGCNDGILLKHFAKKKYRHLGIEPSENVAEEANKIGVNTISKFFDSNLADEIIGQYGKADLIMSANVMCHIPNIVDIAQGIKKLLKSDGIVKFEDPYLGDVIEKISYDQIYDEHVFLFSCLSVKHLFQLVGLELIDAERQSTHGGSMRYTLAHKGKYQISNRVVSLLEEEISKGLNSVDTFHRFAKNVQKSRDDLINILNSLKKDGLKVAGYAATSKSTTILNYCKINEDLIHFISDTTPLKIGKFSPGRHIPIKSYNYFHENKPDVAFLFAWNHATEIFAKETHFVSNGGKWLTHVPSVMFVS